MYELGQIIKDKPEPVYKPHEQCTQPQIKQ